MAGETRVVIADDHPIFRFGLVQVLQGEPDIQVVAEADSGPEALSFIRKWTPDVAVIDVQMPGLSGFEVAEQAAREGLPTRLVFLTMHGEPAMLERAVSAGASGYVLKDDALSEVVQGVRAVAAGRTFVSPALSDYLVSRAFPRRGGPAATCGVASLTDRERYILHLIAESRTSKEIAEALGIHYRTVENQRTAISQKLGLQGTHALIRFAFAHKHEL